MSAPPKTVLTASAEEEAAIRAAVRYPDTAMLGADYVVATHEHVAALLDFLSDPAVSAPIYDLPQPITHDTVEAWVSETGRMQELGEALLLVRLDPTGSVLAYHRFTVWPERSSAEIAGAIRADAQNKGVGKLGAAQSFGWMFTSLGVRLICATAALDNPRSARVIEAAGFTAMGEREGVRSDGSVRRSLYWEMTRETWQERGDNQEPPSPPQTNLEGS
jgi:RimJ/RimL family protein N-acetyltransferase